MDFEQIAADVGGSWGDWTLSFFHDQQSSSIEIEIDTFTSQVQGTHLHAAVIQNVVGAGSYIEKHVHFFHDYSSMHDWLDNVVYDGWQERFTFYEISTKDGSARALMTKK